MAVGNKSDLPSYIVGFVLAVLLTAVSFAFVAWQHAPRSTVLWVIAVTAIVHVGVHLRFFLHITAFSFGISRRSHDTIGERRPKR